MKNNNILLFLIIGLMLIVILPISIAEVQSLGIVKQNDCITLKQTCTSCTYVKISAVTYPNKTTINNLWSMTKDGIMYNYTFCDTSELGQYIIDGYGDIDATDTEFGYDFEVTPNGDNLSSANSMLYIILIIINFSLFAFFIIIGYKIDGNNYKDEEGIINVNNKKYLKMGCFFMAYILMTWFMFNLYIISSSYLNLDFMSRLFWTGWILLGWGLVVVIPAYFIFNIVWLFVDRKWIKLWEQGIPALNE